MMLALGEAHSAMRPGTAPHPRKEKRENGYFATLFKVSGNEWRLEVYVLQFAV